MPIKKTALLLLLLLMINLSTNVPLHSVTAQGSTDAPWLYYYSIEHNGFVIEHADGTESRLWLEGYVSEPSRFVTGPLWSPDGRYFAWQWVNQDYQSYVYVFDIDGNLLVSLEEPYVQLFRWANDANYLLLWSWGDVGTTIKIIDAVAGQITYDDEFQTDIAVDIFALPPHSELAWLSEPQAFVVPLVDELGSALNCTVYRVIRVDGEISEHQLSLCDDLYSNQTYFNILPSTNGWIHYKIGTILYREHILTGERQLVIQEFSGSPRYENPPNGRILVTPEATVAVYETSSTSGQIVENLRNNVRIELDDSITWGIPVDSISPNGQFMGLVADRTALLNLDNGTVENYGKDGRAIPEAFAYGHVHWHPEDHRWFLIYDNASVAGGGGGGGFYVRVANINDHYPRSISNMRHGIVEWLPDRVNANEIGSTRPRPPEPQPIFRHRAEMIVHEVSWSPDNKLVAIGSNYTYQYSVEVATNSVVQRSEISAPIEWYRIGDEYRFRESAQNCSGIECQPRSDSFIVQGGTEIVDRSTGELIFNGFPSRLFQPAFSSDESLFGGLFLFRQWLHLYDTATWEQINIPYIYLSDFAFSSDGELIAVAAGWDVEVYRLDDLLYDGDS